MEKIEKDKGNKNEKNKAEGIDSLKIKNAHASGDGSLGRDEETLMNKTPNDKKDAVKKDAEQY